MERCWNATIDHVVFVFFGHSFYHLSSISLFLTFNLSCCLSHLSPFHVFFLPPSLLLSLWRTLTLSRSGWQACIYTVRGSNRTAVHSPITELVSGGLNLFVDNSSMLSLRLFFQPSVLWPALSSRVCISLSVRYSPSTRFLLSLLCVWSGAVMLVTTATMSLLLRRLRIMCAVTSCTLPSSRSRGTVLASHFVGRCMSLC